MLVRFDLQALIVLLILRPTPSSLHFSRKVRWDIAWSWVCLQSLSFLLRSLRMDLGSRPSSSSLSYSCLLSSESSESSFSKKAIISIICVSVVGGWGLGCVGGVMVSSGGCPLPVLSTFWLVDPVLDTSWASASGASGLGRVALAWILPTDVLGLPPLSVFLGFLARRWRTCY